MIIGMVGRMGSGKTISAVRYAYNYFKQDYKIMSNIKLNFEYTPITYQTLIDFANNSQYLDRTIILYDEIATTLDSRNSVSKRNKILSYFIILTRKLSCNLIYTVQRYHMIDKRLRDNTDIIIQCTTKKYRGEQYTHNYIMIMLEQGYKVKQEIFKTKKYYNLYNTRELVKIE